MKKGLIGLAIVLVVGAAVVLMLNYPPEPAGKATGASINSRSLREVQSALWNEMARAQDSYLSAYSEAFDEQPDDPMEVLSAFNEMAYQVTGAGGLWRSTVPNKFFGCQSNEHMPVCKKAKSLESVYGKWDDFQKKVEAVETPRQAKRFLKKHAREMKEYIDTFVPERESLSAIEATPHFSQNLKASL